MKRLKSARKQSDQTTLDSIGDLEVDLSPEEVLMSAVTSDSSKDRTERALVVPWLRFMWEAYRQVLEVLKNARKLENVYHLTCVRCFQFCREHKRTNEFRRLCHMLRQHLESLARYQSSHDETWSPLTMERHMDTRFMQLETASNMDLWPEAYRTIDDIYQLMDMTSKPPSPRLKAMYLEKLSSIFWESRNYLFHAYSAYRHCAYVITHNQKTTSQQKQVLTTAAVMAALSVPLNRAANSDAQFVDIGALDDNKRQLSALLELPASPTRDSLLNEMRTKGVFDDMFAVLQPVQVLLEAKTTNPLTLVSSLVPMFAAMSENQVLGRYVPQLERLTVIRLVQHLAKMYDTISIAFFTKLTEGLSLSMHDMEQLLVRASKHGHVTLRIDHHTQALKLGAETLDSERLSKQLTVLATRMQSVVERISPPETTAAQASARKALFAAARKSISRSAGWAQERFNQIESRKREDEDKARRREEEVRIDLYVTIRKMQR